MKILPLVVWVIQAAVLIGGAAIVTHLIHDSQVESIIWIAAGVIVAGCFVFALFMMAAMDDNRW